MEKRESAEMETLKITSRQGHVAREKVKRREGGGGGGESSLAGVSRDSF